MDRVNYLAELPPLRRIELMGERFATAQDERLVEAAISAAGLDAAFDEPPPEPGPGTPLLPF